MYLLSQQWDHPASRLTELMTFPTPQKSQMSFWSAFNSVTSARSSHVSFKTSNYVLLHGRFCCIRTEASCLENGTKLITIHFYIIPGNPHPKAKEGCIFGQTQQTETFHASHSQPFFSVLAHRTCSIKLCLELMHWALCVCRQSDRSSAAQLLLTRQTRSTRLPALLIALPPVMFLMSYAGFCRQWTITAATRAAGVLLPSRNREMMFPSTIPGTSSVNVWKRRGLAVVAQPCPGHQPLQWPRLGQPRG